MAPSTRRVLPLVAQCLSAAQETQDPQVARVE